MAKEIIKYQCETCRKVYATMERANACEGTHIHPIDIVDELFNIGAVEPHGLMVKMSDGSVIQYDMHVSAL